ncbi:MAG: hypothetical protein J6R95_05675 [Bacteroidales bacterium]|nr:hypothetical protein [Bacteroidales bacterium]
MDVKYKLFKQLAPSDQRKIIEAITKQYEEDLFNDLAEAQIKWIKMMCIALYRLGLPQDQILIALGSWRSLYRKNSKFSGEEEQSAWLTAELEKVFPDGFPEQVVQDVKKL